MNLSSQSNIKSIYRVTGTPENFLTALRFKIWGFNEENFKHWKKLTPGDIIYFHSKGTDSKFVNRPKPGIIGFGVVGNNFFENKTPMWIDEKLDQKSYPYRFAFSEIYLFSFIPINEDWDSTTLFKFDQTKSLVERLVEAAIPLSDLDGFPHMGSYSAIQNSGVKNNLLNPNRDLNFYCGDTDQDIITKSAELTPLSDKKEALRYATTLTMFDDVKQRIVSEQQTEYKVDSTALALAEKSHFDIISYFLTMFQNRDYNVMFNNHVDLYAFKEKKSFLIEAKSIENRNFIRQSRKGIIQLFEYNYFEVSKFKKDKGLVFNNEVSLLATSKRPEDEDYIKFINSLKIKTMAIQNNKPIFYGNSVNEHDF